METTRHPLKINVREVLAIFAMLAGVYGALMWWAEPWQRPVWLLPISDEVWLAAALAVFALAALLWPMHGKRWWMWHLVLCGALCGIVLPVSRNAQSAGAVRALLNHEEVASIVGRDFPDANRGKEWFENLKKFWRDEVLHLVLPPPSHPHGNSLESTIPPDPYDHLLETSRWPTRRAFLREIMTDESDARLATGHWHRLFPAVVGQDVTLAHRIELIEWLDHLAGDESRPPTCRDAAAFWMALVVLTDTDAFGDRAGRALAHMRVSEEPPVSTASLMWMRPTGDAWMRALDLLVAMMPEEQHAELTSPLTRNATLLRRATRQRVRGMQHHAHAIMREIEAFPWEFEHALVIARYLDTGDRIAIHNRVAQLAAMWIPHQVTARRLEGMLQSHQAIRVILDDLHESSRAILHEALVETFVKRDRRGSIPNPLREMATTLDAASAEPMLSGAERVVLAARTRHAVANRHPHPVEDVMDFFDVMMAEDEPGRMWGVYRQPRRQFEKARTMSHGWPEAEMRFHAYRNGYIGAEHLPEDWVGYVLEHGVQTLERLTADKEVWGPFMQDAHLATRLLEDLEAARWMGWITLFDYLEKHPPDAEVGIAIRDHFTRQSMSLDRMERIHAFRVLKRFSSWAGDDGRTAFRARLLQFFHDDRPSLREWVGAHMANPDIRWNSVDVANHRGEWIPWEDDALSAAFSWSSQIHLELSSLPLIDDPEMGVFRHLATSGLFFDLSEWGHPLFDLIVLDAIVPTTSFSDPVPSPPFVETPWQRARALHLRRPDLEFSARPIFRPTGDRVRMRSEIEMIEY